MEVRTFLRLRPLAFNTPQPPHEISEDGRTLTLKEIPNVTQPSNLKRKNSNNEPPSDHEYKFNQIFQEESTQKAGIIAHGETISGKSYTIFGIENIQQEEFSIDLDDPKDTRGLVMKTIHYIFNMARWENQRLNLEVQMFDVYLDQLRDLSKGKTNKFNKTSQVQLFDREKEVEVEETSGGEVQMFNLQSVKIGSPKEAASFLEKCIEYQKKLEKDNQQFSSMAHTVLILTIEYGGVNSQLFFVELGAPDRKRGKKHKEGYIVSSGITALFKLLQDFQFKMSEDEKESISFRDHKITLVLKGLFKEYQKIALISHLYLTESNVNICLKTLENSERVSQQMQTKHSLKKRKSTATIEKQIEDQEEFNIDQAISNLNKDNFDLRNSIEAMKKSYKIKLEELQQLLGISCDIEYLLRNKDSAPQIQQILENRKCIEKADYLIRQNKEIEKRIDFLTFDLQELRKEKKIEQENFSQTIIQLNHQLELLKEERIKRRMNTENKLRMNRASIKKEFDSITKNREQITTSHQTLSRQLAKTAVFGRFLSQEKLENELDEIKEKGYHEGVKKYDKVYEKQKKVIEDEEKKISENLNANLQYKQLQVQKFVDTFNNYQNLKEQILYQNVYRKQMDKIKSEMVKLYDIAKRQNQITQGLMKGAYSGAGQGAKIPESELIEMPKPEQFTLLFKTIEERKQDNSNSQIQKKIMVPKIDLRATQSLSQNANMKIQEEDQENVTIKKDLVNVNVKQMTVEQVKQFILKMQQEVKRVKQNPLNPDKIRLEKVKEIVAERDKFKDLYISESIKNKEINAQMNTNDRYLISQTGKRPMTTVSSVSSLKNTVGGGFFVTQMRPDSRFKPSMRKPKGLKEFFQREDDTVQKLREKLKDDSASTFKPSTPDFSNPNKLEEYIDVQKQRKMRVTMRQRMKEMFDSTFKIKVGKQSIYLWRSRKFEEMLYLHFPRLLFLGFSCYIIYRINLKQQQDRRWKEGVQSFRQEEIQKQISQISSVIGVDEPNTFEPYKNVKLDKNYSGDQFQYLYQKEEKDLQDKLFQLYEELEDEQETEE